MTFARIAGVVAFQAICKRLEKARHWSQSALIVPVAFTVSMASATAQQSYPMLMSLSPTAAQVGQSSEHTLESRYSMFGAAQVLVSGDGVQGEVVTAMEPGKDGKEPTLTQIKVKFTIEADAVPGVRDFRVIGPSGPSTLGQLVVTRDPVLIESAANDTRETAQTVTVPATLCGCVEKAEDVDFYRFHLDQPATLTFQCLAMRLQDRIHDLQTHVDPILTLRNAVTGSTLMASDNAFAADPFVSAQLESGDYFLEVRDVRYQGNKYWNYAIEVTDRPYVSQVFPNIVSVGQTTQLELVGNHLTASAAEFPAPMDLLQAGSETCTVDATLQLNDTPLNPIPVVVTGDPVITENEGDNNAIATAFPITLPGTIAGRIESESDIDCYSFEARKGDRLSVEVIARRCGSNLDSIIRILNDKGAALTENDDARLWGRRTIQDSMIENWTCPADGRYVVEIRDVHLRGSAGAVYGLKIAAATPRFDLVLDTDKTWLTPGTCAALFVRANRRNGFDGEIQLAIEGLPEGVTASCGRILSGKSVDGCIVLQASPDAKLTAGNVRVYGTATIPQEDTDTVLLRTEAIPMQEIYMPGGGRSHFSVQMHTVAVGHPSDLRDVHLSTQEVSLKPGESVAVNVELARAEGFDKNVTLDVLFQHLSSVFANTLPPGVTIDAKNSQTLLTGSKTSGVIMLTAAKNAAPVDRQQCCVMANVSINFVMKATYSSPPLFVSVAAP